MKFKLDQVIDWLYVVGGERFLSVPLELLVHQNGLVPLELKVLKLSRELIKLG